MILSPLVYLLSCLIFFCSFILLAKSLILSTPLILFVILRLVILALVDLYKIRHRLKLPFKWDYRGIQLLMGFVYLGYGLCFFGALTHLPLISFVAIYLSYPILIPWVLKAWIGKRLTPFLWIPSFLFLIGFACSFSGKLQLNNILVVVALFAILLKPIYQTGYLKLEVSEPPLVLWITRYGVSIIASGFLLIATSYTFRWQSLLIALTVIVLELAYKQVIPLCKKALNSLTFIGLFNLSIFICALLDFLIFKTLPPFQLILAALLLYFGIFFTFLQKTLLANSLHDL